MRDFEYGVEPGSTLDVRRCVACDTEFLFPRPDAADLVDFYPSDYHAFNDDHGRLATRLVHLRAKRRAHQYEELLGGRKGSLFDVGTGDCRHFDELREELDLHCAGVELQPEVAAAGRARGYDVTVGTLEEMDLTGHEGRYDIVSMNHVLEHVIEPDVVVDRARRLLRPGGHLLGQLPTNSSWEAKAFGRRWGGYHYPRHLQMFSRAGLERLLRHGGFTDVQLHTAPHIQTAISLQNTLNAWGWDPPKRYGKVPGYGALLGVVAPFELVAYAADRGGIIDFHAVAPR
ncbi:MAG: class I SAM-dependent methyltransferase [Acidimicrobiia bacterium]|nr:class I SAM-dependent methyltransferase [Acidimicrobiia bacterium]